MRGGRGQEGEVDEMMRGRGGEEEASYTYEDGRSCTVSCYELPVLYIKIA
jgi:hypothetical protein